MGKDFFQRGKISKDLQWILGGMEMDIDMVEGISLRGRKCRGVVGKAKVAA